MLRKVRRPLNVTEDDAEKALTSPEDVAEKASTFTEALAFTDVSGLSVSIQGREKIEVEEIEEATEEVKGCALDTIKMCRVKLSEINSYLRAMQKYMLYPNEHKNASNRL